MTMAETVWTPVTDAAGKVLGYVSAPDPDEPDAGYFEADRLPKVARRAAALAPVAELYGNESFGIDAVSDACGLSEDDQDSAANVAWALMQVELGL
jgi:hypothetical protein